MPLISRQLFALSLCVVLYACSGGGSSSTPVTVDISGTITYEDKLYDTTGFTGATEMKAVRHAVVELVGVEGVVATARTDDSGNYTISGSGTRSYLRVQARSASSSDYPVEVVTPDGNIIAVTSQFDSSATIVNVDITLNNEIAGAFNILDVYQSAMEFTLAQGSGSLPTLTAKWEPCNIDGTYTTKTANTVISISLLGIHSNCPADNDPAPGIQSDTDEYDDDVLWHEYGHYLEYAYGTLDSPGGVHLLYDTAQDIRLAWSEGWGDFISGAIKAWLYNTDPNRLSTTLAHSWYIDTYGTGVIRHDFMANFYAGTELLYATNEGAVAKMLWLTHDHPNFSLDTIWQTFSNSLPLAGVTSTLESVWDDWADGADTFTLTTLRTDILADRQVYYSEDIYEPDDITRTPNTIGTHEDHTLYRDGGTPDIDTIPFAVTANSVYRIETYNLHNGADTVMSILDSNEAVIYVNDNHDGEVYPADPSVVYNNPLYWMINDGCKLSSRIEFTAPTTATYYVKIESAGKTLAAGNYGDYQLLISENPTTQDVEKCP